MPVQFSVIFLLLTVVGILGKTPVVCKTSYCNTCAVCPLVTVVGGYKYVTIDFSACGALTYAFCKSYLINWNCDVVNSQQCISGTCPGGTESTTVTKTGGGSTLSYTGPLCTKPTGSLITYQLPLKATEIVLQLYDSSFISLDTCINGYGWAHGICKGSCSSSSACEVIIPLSSCASPTVAPAVVPSFVPSALPSAVPSAMPSVEPTVVPSAMPSVEPTVVPSVMPSVEPTVVPSAMPSVEPTVVPSVMPSVEPTVVPSAVPSVVPSAIPSVVPSAVPSVVPSAIPTVVPSAVPSVVPSAIPSVVPSAVPSVVPSAKPSVVPTVIVTTGSAFPSAKPTATPKPSTAKPSAKPSTIPTNAPACTNCENCVHFKSCKVVNGWKKVVVDISSCKGSPIEYVYCRDYLVNGTCPTPGTQNCKDMTCPGGSIQTGVLTKVGGSQPEAYIGLKCSLPTPGNITFTVPKNASDIVLQIYDPTFLSYNPCTANYAGFIQNCYSQCGASGVCEIEVNIPKTCK